MPGPSMFGLCQRETAPAISFVPIQLFVEA